MPFAFPSHQGLIAPLWRRWPGRFDVLGLCVGAAMPDVVDGFVGLYRGHLGQSVGHSLIGVALFCVPGGVVLWIALKSIFQRLPVPARPGLALRAHRALIGSIPIENRPLRLLLCLGLGAFSHLFFDLISHGGFEWFYPWFTPGRIFPEWWYTVWFRIPVPGYEQPYPFGPHFLVWAALSVIGIISLFRPLFKKQ